MYQKQAGFLPPKTLPTYEGGSLHTLHGFFRKLKNENHQAQFTYIKACRKKLKFNIYIWISWISRITQPINK